MSHNSPPQRDRECRDSSRLMMLGVYR
ncbi:Protein of unknown function [Pyronema omphalodes CBS 100304]|uniref:Uncharacterized protein n=1 Tax=Pyronema omphalodes (strain CBS 100304) TaxID=1076935 RepID=U4LAS9_PYROM|nr:Protein of unknown function [Pyronema omphalodes CBS 100304]